MVIKFKSAVMAVSDSVSSHVIVTVSTLLAACEQLQQEIKQIHFTVTSCRVSLVVGFNTHS